VRRRGPVPAAAVGLALVGLALRFTAGTPLWLDEALSVNIARLPVGDLLAALRHDGSPPLYYLLLHGWVAAFGEGPLAVRALSGALSVLGIPAAWAFAREATGSGRVAAITALLVATSPFAIRYAAEARMYSLVMLLVALGGWALLRYLRAPSLPAAAAVAACSGLLALTHYWAFYLLAAVAAGLLLRRRLAAVAAVAAGAVLFLPWLPSFIFQLTRTGTPWARRPAPAALVQAVVEWSGKGPLALLLFVLLLALAALGAYGRAVDGRRIELDLRGRAPGTTLGAAAFGAMLLGVAAGLVLGSGYAVRYTAIAVVPFLVLVALGATTLADDRLRTGAVGAALVLGLVGAVPGVVQPRTQAGAIARALRGRVAAGDVVVYCPDQLGPAVSRLLPRGTPQQVFPTGGPPDLVDWVDYGDRNAAADPVAFADRLLREHAGGTVWLVVSSGYRTFGNRCDVLAERLRAARHETVDVRSRSSYLERASLVRFAP